MGLISIENRIVQVGAGEDVGGAIGNFGHVLPGIQLQGSQEFEQLSGQLQEALIAGLDSALVQDGVKQALPGSFDRHRKLVECLDELVAAAGGRPIQHQPCADAPEFPFEPSRPLCSTFAALVCINTLGRSVCGQSASSLLKGSPLLTVTAAAHANGFWHLSDFARCMTVHMVRCRRKPSRGREKLSSVRPSPPTVRVRADRKSGTKSESELSLMRAVWAGSVAFGICCGSGYCALSKGIRVRGSTPAFRSSGGRIVNQALWARKCLQSRLAINYDLSTPDPDAMFGELSQVARQILLVVPMWDASVARSNGITMASVATSLFASTRIQLARRSTVERAM